MSKARDLADSVSTGGILEDGAISVSEISDLTATATELNYVDGVTSNVQTQIDTKAPLASPSFTGTVGIGTSSPDVNSGLTVESSTTSGQIMVKGSNGGNAGVAFQASGQTTNFSIYENSSADLVFQKHATEKFRFGSSGGFGINGANYGTAGQVLKSNGSGAAPSWGEGGASTGKAIAMAIVFG